MAPGASQPRLRGTAARRHRARPARCGPGDDRLEGGYDNDTITGGPGRDTIYGDDTSAQCGYWGHRTFPFGNDTIEVRDGEVDTGMVKVTVTGARGVKQTAIQPVRLGR